MLDDNYNLKIIDYGFVCPLEGTRGEGVNETRVGTPNYMSPELLRGETYNGQVVDLFAMGVILFVMKTGIPPFVSASDNDKIYKFIKQYRWDEFWALHERSKPAGFFQPSFKSLIELML